MAFNQRDVVVAVLRTLNRMDCKSYDELANMCDLENTDSFRHQIKVCAKTCSMEYFTLVSYGILVKSTVEEGPEGGLVSKTRLFELPEYIKLSRPTRKSEAEDVRVLQEYMLSIKPGVRLCYHLIAMGSGILMDEVGARRLKMAIKLSGMEVIYSRRCVEIISVPKLEPISELDAGEKIKPNNVPVMDGWDFYHYLKNRPSKGVSFLQYDHDSGLLFNMVGDGGAVKWEVVGKINKNVVGDGNDQSL